LPLVVLEIWRISKMWFTFVGKLMQALAAYFILKEIPISIKRLFEWKRGISIRK